mmetsp:Transcript_35790/g.106270  ORF Transcript_35790/g.106270 Transcript_35790/m.106270 type:complete len:251 (+) Transcript_35790:97-849(+)
MSKEEVKHLEMQEAPEDETRLEDDFANGESEGDEEEGETQPKAGRRRRRRRHRRGGGARGDCALACSGKGSSEEDSATAPSEVHVSSTPRNVVTWFDLCEPQRTPASAPAPARVNENCTPKNSASQVQDSIIKTIAWPRSPQGGALCWIGRAQPDHSANAVNHMNACGPLPHAACAADVVAGWGCNPEFIVWQPPAGGTCAPGGQEWTSCHSDQLRQWLCGNLHHADGGPPSPAELERMLVSLSQEVYED